MPTNKGKGTIKTSYKYSIEDSITVDGAWNTNTGNVEYQGINYKTKVVLFHAGPLEDGTINIVEFLAIVHTLALCNK